MRLATAESDSPETGTAPLLSALPSWHRRRSMLSGTAVARSEYDIADQKMYSKRWTELDQVFAVEQANE